MTNVSQMARRQIGFPWRPNRDGLICGLCADRRKRRGAKGLSVSSWPADTPGLEIAERLEVVCTAIPLASVCLQRTAGFPRISGDDLAIPAMAFPYCQVGADVFPLPLFAAAALRPFAPAGLERRVWTVSVKRPIVRAPMKAILQNGGRVQTFARYGADCRRLGLPGLPGRLLQGSGRTAGQSRGCKWRNFMPPTNAQDVIDEGRCNCMAATAVRKGQHCSKVFKSRDPGAENLWKRRVRRSEGRDRAQTLAIFPKGV